MFFANGHFASCLGPPCRCEVRLYELILVVGVAIFFGQLFGGFFSGSLALLADTGHVLSDNVGTIVSILVALLILGGKNGNERRVRARGGWINAVLLGTGAVWIFVEALERFRNPHQVDALAMLCFAAAGTIGNYLQHWLMQKTRGAHDHVTHKAQSRHILGDLWMSISVCIGAILMLTVNPVLGFLGVGEIRGIERLDPLFSMFIASVMLSWSAELMTLLAQGKITKDP